MCVRACICAVQTRSSVSVVCVVDVNKVRGGHQGVRMTTLAPCFFSRLSEESLIYISRLGAHQNLSLSLSPLAFNPLVICAMENVCLRAPARRELVIESKSNLLVPCLLLHHGKRSLPGSTQRRGNRVVIMACWERRSWESHEEIIMIWDIVMGRMLGCG